MFDLDQNKELYTESDQKAGHIEIESYNIIGGFDTIDRSDWTHLYRYFLYLNKSMVKFGINGSYDCNYLYQMRGKDEVNDL